MIGTLLFFVVLFDNKCFFEVEVTVPPFEKLCDNLPVDLSGFEFTGHLATEDRAHLTCTEPFHGCCPGIPALVGVSHLLNVEWCWSGTVTWYEWKEM